MNSEEARERSKYLDRRIREASGLDVKPVAGELAATENPDGFKQHRGGPYWNAKLTTKRRAEPFHVGQRTSTAQWENELRGGFKEPPQ
jgi:hypothetical protein